jgi:hypothetical protein
VEEIQQSLEPQEDEASLKRILQAKEIGIELLDRLARSLRR